MSLPANSIFPDVTARRPSRVSAKAVCPLPSTPATHKTSPARTSSVTPSITLCWRSSTTTTSVNLRTTSPVLGAFLSTVRSTSLPTISDANSPMGVSGGTESITLPPRITVTTSATAFTSRNLWVIKTIEVPSPASCRMMPINSSVSCGVRTAVGSSRIKIFASRANALTISTRC